VSAVRRSGVFSRYEMNFLYEPERERPSSLTETCRVSALGAAAAAAAAGLASRDR
jgi:hypothetical protein